MGRVGPHSEEPCERAGVPIRLWLGPSRPSCLAWPGARLPSMPAEYWQQRLMDLAGKWSAACANVPPAEGTRSRHQRGMN